MKKRMMIAGIVAIMALGFLTAIVTAGEPAATLPKRAVSVAVDAEKSTIKYQSELGRTQTATDASLLLSELTAYVQESTGQDVDYAILTKNQDHYAIGVAIKAPVEKLPLMPKELGVMGIQFVGNCPTNSHFQVQFQPERLAKLTEQERKVVEHAVIALATFNHRLPMATQAAVKSKGMLKDAWMIEVVFDQSVFSAKQVTGIIARPAITTGAGG